ncbi:MAG: VOC family protein [Anaerolineales bacterium]
MAYLKALSIDHANMNVKNLDESVDFYSTLFGFELKKNQPDQQAKIIGNESIKLCLYQHPDLIFTKGINHIGFHIENFDEIVEKCKTLKISIAVRGDCMGIIQVGVYNRSEWIRSRTE